MKKIISLSLAFCLMLTLVACGKKEESISVQVPQEILGQQELIVPETTPTEPTAIAKPETDVPVKETVPTQEHSEQDANSYKLGDPIALKVTFSVPESEEIAQEKQAFWESVILERQYVENNTSMVINFADMLTMMMLVDANNTNVTRISGLFEDCPISATIYVTASQEVYYQECTDFGDGPIEEWYKVIDANNNLDSIEALSTETQGIFDFTDRTTGIKYLGSRDGIDYVALQMEYEDENVPLILELDPDNLRILGLSTTSDGYEVRALLIDASQESFDIPHNITNTITLIDALTNYSKYMMAILMSAQDMIY